MTVYILILVCLVTSTHTQGTNQREATRQVNKPPLIVQQPPREIPFRIAHSIELPCVAEGFPTPFYTWTMDDKPFDPSGNQDRVVVQQGVGTLVFANPLERDQGFYQCNATNLMGTALTIGVYMRVAYLRPFRESSVRTYTPKLGAPLTLPCVAPQSYPKPYLYWSLLDGDRLNQILTDDRVTVDMTGALHFANVIKEDLQNRNRYACIAQNPVVRELMQGAYAVVDPQGQTELFSAPEIVYFRSTNEVALRGQTFRTMCIFAGNPTPIVSWTKITDDAYDGKLPDNTRTEDYGQTLVIVGVREDNAGIYQCTGQNEVGYTPLQKSVTLSVDSEPVFVDGWKPQSVEIAEGETGRFRCKGNGKPEPRVVFFINGRKVESSSDKNSNRSVETNLLTFYNVKKMDSKVIQCNVTNKYGYAFTNAYLNVMEEAPVIEDPPQKYLIVSEGQKVNLTCRVYGAPKPKVVWHKTSGEQLTGGRYWVHTDGNLEIEDISLVDAGMYFCTASNRIDTVTANGELIVRRKTLIQTAPQDVMVEKGTEAKFTCTATTDPDEIKQMRIDWKKDGQLIDYHRAQRVYKNVVDNSLTISGTVYLDTGTYTCMASNGIDSSQAGAELIVQEPPDPPSKIEVKCESEADKDNPEVTRIMAEVFWQPGRDHYAPILYYKLQYNTSFSADTWYDVSLPRPKPKVNTTKPYVDPLPGILPNATRYDILLSPFGNYTFRVLARNKVGYSKPSQHTTMMCTTEADVPYKNPENVIAEGDRPGNMVIFWTPMAPVEWNGPTFQYLVSWQPADRSVAVKTQTIGRPDAWHYVVEDLDGGQNNVYKPYRVRVKAKNSKGQSKADAPWVIGYTGEGIPRAIPMNVQVDPGSVKATIADIDWTHVDTSPEEVRGFFKGYKIQYARKHLWPNNMMEEDVIINKGRTLYPRPRYRREIREFNVTTSWIQYRMRHLPPNTIVRLWIRVLNKYYVGPPSAPIEFKTEEGEPGPPAKFDVRARGPTYFQLEWEAPKEHNGHLIGYNISYQLVSGLNLGGLQVIEGISFAPKEKLEVRLTGLKPGSSYRVFLSASTRAGIGEAIFLDMNTLPAGIPSAPTFGITTWSNHSFTVQWMPSRGVNPGSVFLVEYRIRGQYLWRRTEQVYRSDNYTVWPLDSGTVYQVRVVATNGEGDEAASEYLEVRTKGTAPGNFRLSVSFWFYGIFIALILIIAFMVIFIVAKKTTDINHKQKEDDIDVQQRQIEAEQAALQMGILNQESQDFMYSQGSFGAELKPLGDRSYEVADDDREDPEYFKKLPVQPVEYPSRSYDQQDTGYGAAPPYTQTNIPAQAPPVQYAQVQKGRKSGVDLKRSEGERGSKDTFV